MKSWWLRTENGKLSLDFREVEKPRLRPGEVIVRVRAAGLNRGELIVGSVMHGGADKLGGTEVAGEVHAVGDGVSGLGAGDRIMGRVMGHDRGGFAEYAAMYAHQAMRVPERLSWEQAAAIPVSFLVAYDALVPYGHLKPGEWLLVAGASSGAGVASIQAGKVLGGRVIGTSGSQQKLTRLKAIGLDVGICTREPDFAAAVKEATNGRGVDLAVNCVGGSFFSECMRTLALEGRLATVGYVDGVMKGEIDLQQLHANRQVVFGVSNSRIGGAQHAETVRGFTRDLLPAFADGRIAPVIDRIFAFRDLPAAKDYMESNAQVGKIVVNDF